MFGRMSSKRGFTLIELMVVVVIIGILAALALPRFFQSTIRTKQSEAKLVLKQICTSQMLYRAESPTNAYFSTGATASAATPDAFSAIDVQIAPNALYSYTVVLVGVNWQATATANLDGDGTEDIWTIDQTGILTCTSNDATG